MKKEKLTVFDYGIFIFSPSILAKFLKSNKVRTKNIVNYFDRNREKLCEAVSKGIFIPLSQVSSATYWISIEKPIGEEYTQKVYCDNINLQVDDDLFFWICSANLLYEWNPNDFDDTKGEYIEQIADGPDMNLKKFRLAFNDKAQSLFNKLKISGFESKDNQYAYLIEITNSNPNDFLNYADVANFDFNLE